MESSSSKRETIDKCQTQIWKIRRELESYAVLFKGFNLAEVEGEALYGTALALERMSKKLDKVNDRLSQIF